MAKGVAPLATENPRSSYMTASARLSVLVLVFAVCIALVAVAGSALRESLQRRLFIARAERATGLALEVRRVTGGDGSFRLTDVRAHTRGGGVVLAAPAARVDVRGAQFALELDRPQIAVLPERLRGDELARTSAALAQVTFTRGTLTLASGDVPAPLLVCDDVNASLRAQGGRVSYDVTANARDGAATYALESRAVVRADGSPAQRWSAPALPLDRVAALLGATPDSHSPTGRLRDITVEFGTPLRASARLDDAAFALDDRHRLSSLHGEVRLEGDGIGSKLIAGRLDGGVPFDASGEVHDLDAGGAWLYGGSKDLRALGRLARSIADEPGLRSAHVEATAPGLAFGQYALATDHGPLAVSVLSADPAEPTLRIDTAIAEDHVVSGGERTSSMGVRTHAVGGVNGDYFDIGRTYQPQGMLVRSGRIVRGPTDRAALAIDREHHVTFGEFHLRGLVKTRRGTMPVTSFNDWPPGDVAVITPDFGKELRPSMTAAFVALSPVDTAGKRFRVVSVEPAGSAPHIGFGIAVGALVRTPLPRVGEVVELSYRVDPPLEGTVAGIGGGPILLREGAWFEDPHAPAPDERLYRWPVLALARQADDRLLLVAVDGRHPERSVGATRPEFAALLQRLGAVDAMALDSGGSVTLVSRAPGDRDVSVRNVPSDNSAERWISDALFFYSAAPAPSIVPLVRAPTPPPEARPAP